MNAVIGVNVKVTKVTIEAKWGTGTRSHIIYATVMSDDGLEIHATLDYCLREIEKRGWHLTNPTELLYFLADR